MINFTKLDGFDFSSTNTDFLNEDFDSVGLGSSDFLTNIPSSMEFSYLSSQHPSSSPRNTFLDNQQKNSPILFSKKITNYPSPKNTITSSFLFLNQNNKRTNENTLINNENIYKKRKKQHKWKTTDLNLVTDLILLKCIKNNSIQNNLSKLSKSILKKFNKSLPCPISEKALQIQVYKLEKEKNIIFLQDKTLNIYKEIKNNLNDEEINKIKNKKIKLFFLQNLDFIKKIADKSLSPESILNSNFLDKKNNDPISQTYYVWTREDFKDILYLAGKHAAKSKSIITCTLDLSKKILNDFKLKENSIKNRTLITHNRLNIAIAHTHISNSRYFSNQEFQNKIMEMQQKAFTFCRLKKTEEQIHNFCKETSEKIYKNIPLKKHYAN